MHDIMTNLGQLSRFQKYLTYQYVVKIVPADISLIATIILITVRLVRVHVLSWRHLCYEMDEGYGWIYGYGYGYWLLLRLGLYLG